MKLFPEVVSSFIVRQVVQIYEIYSHFKYATSPAPFIMNTIVTIDCSFQLNNNLDS